MRKFFQPIHKLIVHEVGDPYGAFSTEDFKNYEIEHPPECNLSKSDGTVEYRCAVRFCVEGTGARFDLHYAGTPVTESGTYSIQAWSEEYRSFEAVDCDGGIALVTGSHNDEARTAT